MSSPASTPTPVCLACESPAAPRRFTAREMMFGLRQAFTYRECGECGSLQIEEIPANLAEYYGGGYYSLAEPRRREGWKALRRAWARWLVRPSSRLGDHVSRRMYRKSPFFTWVRLAHATVDSAILDVGCGSGGLLRRMQRYGFTNLAGLDPYTTSEVEEPGFQIRRGDIGSARGRYDLVMFNHVLEHVADPAATLRQARGLLNPGGRILVRVPVAGSPVAREFGEHWFNLDAPRHLVIPSVRGMDALAARVGLRVAHREFDMQESSFVHSQNYRRDIALKEAGPLPKSVRRHWRRMADRANARGEGDCGVYLLVP
jgi:SAM-dependent methyltransferase